MPAEAKQSSEAPVAAPVPASRVERKRAERRQLVERTAAEVFAQKGYDGANFEEIAARLDMRGASLYYYYPSKEDLFLRAIENATAEVLERLRPIAESDLPAEERLRQLFIEQVLIETRDYPAFAPLFLMSVPVPHVAERLAELGRAHSLVFRDLAREVAKQHRVPRRQATIAVLLALGSLGYIHSWYDPKGPLKLEQLAEEVADQLLQPFLGADATGLKRS